MRRRTGAPDEEVSIGQGGEDPEGPQRRGGKIFSPLPEGFKNAWAKWRGARCAADVERRGRQREVARRPGDRGVSTPEVMGGDRKRVMDPLSHRRGDRWIAQAKHLNLHPPAPFTPPPPHSALTAPAAPFRSETIPGAMAASTAAAAAMGANRVAPFTRPCQQAAPARSTRIVAMVRARGRRLAPHARRVDDACAHPAAGCARAGAGGRDRAAVAPCPLARTRGRDGPLPP